MQIDFYILKTNESQALKFACELVEKIYTQGTTQPIYLHVASLADAERLDQLLWTYKDTSFLPHSLRSSSQEPPPMIQIGFETTSPNCSGTLINFTRQVPDFYAQFNQLIEIVFSDPVVQQLARDRYRFYREQGLEINTHKDS